MIFNINSGSGGAGAELNFKIVGGTTEPVNPSENMIWVNTDTEITSWNLSIIEPENPTDGAIWITIDATGITTPFNVLKKDENNIKLNTNKAYQYINNAWVQKLAKTYQGNAWIEWWDGYLYKSGDEYTVITGGWIGEGKGYDSYATASYTPKITRGDTLTIKPGGDGGSIVRTANKIDLTNYSKLIFDGTASGGSGYDSHYNIRIWHTIGSYSTSNVVATGALRYHSDGQVEINISSITGEHYIGFGIWAAGTVVMRSMRLV